MKISAIGLQSEKNNVNQTSFKGMELTVNDAYKFYAPPFDRDKYDILLELCPVAEDGMGGFKLDKSIESAPFTLSKSYDAFRSSGVLVYPRATMLSDPDMADYMAYRFRLVDKEEAKKAYKNSEDKNSNTVFSNIETKKYLHDPGTVMHDEKFGDFTVISNKMGYTPKSGPALHVFYDSYTSGKGVDRSTFIRNHFNKAHGDLDGILLNKDEELAPYRYVMSNPYIGADSKSSHKYWGENFYRVPSLSVFKKVIVDLYKEGKGYIADGAFTSQSLQSPLFQDVLKRGKESPYYHWFKIKGRLKLGVLPDKVYSSNPQHADAYEHIGFKIVNPLGMREYNPSKPSYIQFFDDRLASEAQIKDTKNLITSYDISQPKDHYDISTHQDSVQPYFFELDYNNKDVRKRFSGYGYKMLTDEHKMYKSFLHEGNSRIIDNIDNFFTFENFDIVNKGRAAGADFWDGSVDLVKMNLSNPSIRPGNVFGFYDVRDYLYGVATYWTKFANDALVSYVAKLYAQDTPESRKEIIKIAQANDLPLEEIAQIERQVDEILTEQSTEYEDAREAITDILESFRYEGLDLSPELQAVVTRPSFKKYMDTPAVKNAVAGFIINSIMKMESNFESDVTEPLKGDEDVLTTEAREKIFAETSPGHKISKFTNNSNSTNMMLTPYGKEVLEILAPTLISYVVTKAIYPNLNVSIDQEQNTLKVSQAIKNASLYQAGVSSIGKIDEDAKNLVNNIYNNLYNPNFKNSEQKKLANLLDAMGLTEYSYRGIEFAKKFVKKTRGGLNWRFDAAKDVADLTATRNGLRNAEKSLDDMVEFWGEFVKNIREINPSSYIVLELTDLWPLYNNMGIYRFEAKNDIKCGITTDPIDVRAEKLRKMDWGKYIDPNIAERMIYEKTGATTGSQYSMFFGLSNNLFSRNFETGAKGYELGNMNALKDKMDDFLKSGPILSITHSHIFWDNHDKPRGLHGLALDMGIFLSRFGINVDSSIITKEDVERAKNAAKRVLGKEVTPDYDSYDLISSKSVAAGDMFLNGFEKVLDNDSIELKVIKQAIRDLAWGKFKKMENPDFIRAEVFGQTSFEITINDIMEQARYLAEKQGITWVSKQKEKEIRDKAFAEILRPALGKMINMTDFLNSTTGIPFFYAGNNMGLSGYEYATKNITQQNRNLVRREWIDPTSGEYKPEIRKYFDRIQASCGLYKEYGLSAIAGGTPIPLPQDDSGNLYALLKYDSKGSNVIHVFCGKGATYDPYQEMSDMRYETPYINMVDKNGIEYKIKDSDGKDTYLKRKVYDESKAKFVDEVDSNGNSVEYCVVNGKLRRKDGQNIVLNETVTTFYKPFVENKISHNDIMQLFHVHK